MKIAIIGAGFTGLTAAYQLSAKNKVVVFEKDKYPGGLAAGFKKENWEWSCEQLFHHLFSSDNDAKKLITELGLKNKLFFTRPKTSVYYANTISQFDSPSSVLCFPHLSLSERIRTGKVTAYLKLANDWQKFEKSSASSWLIKNYGKKTYQILWQPLLKSKFGDEANNISSAWFWARIKKRSANLGYLEGGFQVLIDKLVEKIMKNNGQFVFDREIKSLNEIKQFGLFDRIIYTTPSAITDKILPELPNNYRQKLKNLKMIGTACLLLILKEKFLKDGTYWLNINSPNFPFVAVVEHTNFVLPKHYGSNRLLYVGGYYPPNHRYFKMSKSQILKEYLPYLKKINPGFDLQKSITGTELSTYEFAQPVITVNYSQSIPSYKTPLPGIYLANMQMVYPWDRGVNYAIKMGKEIATLVGSS